MTATPAASAVRRLKPEDAARFQALRLEGFARHPRQFRVAVDDEAALPLDRVAERLAAEHVVGGFDAAGTLVGIGGLGRFAGAKLAHKALLWGMYVREEARGTGLAGAIVAALLDAARDQGVEQVLLTVAADNLPARRLYERWGFEPYGIEPRAVRVDDGYFDELLMLRRLAPPSSTR